MLLEGPGPETGVRRGSRLKLAGYHHGDREGFLNQEGRSRKAPVISLEGLHNAPQAHSFLSRGGAKHLCNL